MRTDTAPHPLPDPAFGFLAELARRLDGQPTAPADALAAVALLTATADPSRADRLHPGAGEPAALVERLAVWALHRVDADTVVLAHHLLTADAALAPLARPSVPC